MLNSKNTAQRAPRRPDAKVAEGMRERLRHILARYSQTEIARRIGVPHSCVSRYLSGTRIPADFVHCLVRDFDVNPAWLLMGEGAVYLADVTADTARTAGDMLELVKAMSAVAEMRLGQLTGKPDRKVLRELNDTLLSHERIRERLNSQTRPFLRQLVDELRSTVLSTQFIDRARLDRAASLRQAVHQLMRFCDDEDLAAELDLAESKLEWLLGNFDKSLAHQRKAFQRCLLAGPDHPRFHVDAKGLIISLVNVGRYKEARRIGNAALALYADTPAHRQQYHDINPAVAIVDAESGDIRRAAARLQESTAALELNRQVHLWVQLLSGIMDFDVGMHFAGHNHAAAHVLLSFASWEENTDHIRTVFERFGDKGNGAPALPPNLWHVAYSRRLLNALTLPRPEAAAEYRSYIGANPVDDSAPPLERYRYAANICRYARTAGETTRAADLLWKAERSLENLPAEFTASVIGRSIHYRNALELIPADTRKAEDKALRAKAQAFFDEYFERGYGCFEAFTSKARAQS